VLAPASVDTEIEDDRMDKPGRFLFTDEARLPNLPGFTDLSQRPTAKSEKRIYEKSTHHRDHRTGWSIPL
jgi:hypothetical protein